MHRIAICGKANTGKNTLATLLYEELQQYYWKDWQIAGIEHKFMAFADPIKEIVLLMFPKAKRECLFGSSQLRAEIIPNAYKDGVPLSYRQALIDIGTRAREYNNLIWIENFHKRCAEVVKGFHYTPNVIMVTDVRFREEFDYLKKDKYFQIRLYRDTGVPTINHASETDQNSITDQEFDYVINNNQTLQELRQEVRAKIIPKLKHNYLPNV